jgi:DNA-binding NarL/FixJ family response regulator
MIRVLVADDHPTMLLGLEVALEGEHDLDLCGSATDGESAYALARSSQPDVVVMDVSMPGIGGIEALRRITRDVPAARVLMLTWQMDQATRTAAREAGAAGYLVKDIDRSHLLAAIRSAHEPAAG